MPEIDQAYDHIKIFDTTLRDGAQSPGIALSAEQSLDIAVQLNRIGVDVIEAGFPISSPENFEAVRRIARGVGGSVIAGLARAQSEDIKVAAEAVRDAEWPRIHTFISTSDIHIAHQMQTTREDVKATTRAAVAQAKVFVDDVEFSPMDATRADDEFTAEVIQIAIEEGATTINIPDTVGYTEPDEYRALLERLIEYVPLLDTEAIDLSVHCHDDLGMAVANSLAGVKAGARQVEVAVNGLGERAGNASLEEVVMALRTRRDLYGADTRIDSSGLAATSRMVSRYSGYVVPANKAIVGTNAFQHESGIHQSGVLRNRSTFEIMRASDVGMDTDGIALGKQSGGHALRHILELEGTYKPAVIGETFAMFKELADMIGSVSRDQLVEIHEEAQRQSDSSYALVKYDVKAKGNGKAGEYSAGVVISGNGRESEQITAENNLEHPAVDGATSALFTAIQQAVGKVRGEAISIEFSSLDLKSVGPSEQTIGKATVTMRVNGKLVTGHGVAFDTMKASGWAYLDAIRQGFEKG